MAKKMFCPQCGTPFTQGDVFCVECGEKLDARKPQQTVEVPVKAAEKPVTEQPKVHIEQEPVENEETILRSGDGYYYKSTFSTPRGVLLLTDEKLSFTARSSKTDDDLEIPLEAVEKVKLTATDIVWQRIGVFLKDKQYIFGVRKGKEWVEQIENTVKEVKSGKAAPATRRNTDYIDEIRRLKELLDAGILTQEEFDAKKKSLLGL